MTRASVVATGLIAVAVAVILWATAFGSYRQAVALRDHGIVGPAVVLEVTRLGDDSFVRVAFTTADGRRVETDVHDFRVDPEPVEGGTMRVRYAATDPSGTIQDARQRPDFLVVWIEALGGLVILAFGVFLVRGFWPLIGERWAP
ncbi:hypothetical protein GCM10027280_59590 [Micromonospora polyrhachis]